jgi:hypothetical protein
MITKFGKSILSIFAITSICSLAQLSNIEKQDVISRQMLQNGGGEQVLSKWTASGGSTAHVTGSNVATGSGALSWNSSSASQTFTSTAVSVKKNLQLRAGVASCLVYNPSGTATHTMQVYDGSNILSSQTVSSNTSGYTRNSIYFTGPSSGSLSVRFVSVASDEPDLYIDDCYLGSAEGSGVSAVAQAQFVGNAYYDTNANCDTWSRTSSTFGAFSSDTDCPAPTVVNNPGPGTISTTDADLPQFTVNNLPPGIYKVTMSGGALIASAVRSTIGISDGTTNSGIVGYNNNTTLGPFPFTTVGIFKYTSTGNRTFQLYTSSASGAVTLQMTALNLRLEFAIERLPLDSQIGMDFDTVAWKVDASVSGAAVGISTTAQSTYTGATNSALTLTNNTDKGSTPNVWIGCASTTDSTGTTCSAANESVSVSFIIPRAGVYEACADFENILIASSGRSVNAFQLVETATNAQTILQEGGARLSQEANSSENTTAFHLCGTFTFNSVGRKMIRLFHEHEVAGTTTTNNINLAAEAARGQRDLKWTVRPVDQQYPAPVFPDLPKLYTAEINCDASSTVVNQTGSWISAVGNRSSAACTVTINSNKFAATPAACGATVESATAGATSVVKTSATSITVYGPSAADYNANIWCAGSR